jgi:uroporphyrinogen-III decarboxylase
VPLIGFQVHLGQLCYAVEGQGSKSFDKPRILFSISEAAHVLLQKITDYFIPKKKSKSGRKCRSNF